MEDGDVIASITLSKTPLGHATNLDASGCTVLLMPVMSGDIIGNELKLRIRHLVTGKKY